MVRAGLVVWWFVSACGRVGFDPLVDSSNDDGSPLSCPGLTSTCGPDGTSPCCGSPLVEGGTFYRSYDVGTDNMFPDMSWPATVSDFRLDKYEVTIGRFRQFVDAGMGTAANPPTTGTGARTLNGMANQAGWDAAWNTRLAADTAALVGTLSCNVQFPIWTDTPGPNEDMPMACVSWFEAMAFCVWDGGFLPTEAEWNYAAAGGSEQRVYPWSSPPSDTTIECVHANHYNVRTDTVCVNNVNRVGSESPSGDGKWGQADLAGNLYEWTLDAGGGAYSNPCIDCAVLTPATTRVNRGGCWSLTESEVRGAARTDVSPGSRAYAYGFRCARAP